MINLNQFFYFNFNFLTFILQRGMEGGRERASEQADTSEQGKGRKRGRIPRRFHAVNRAKWGLHPMNGEIMA